VLGSGVVLASRSVALAVGARRVGLRRVYVLCGRDCRLVGERRGLVGARPSREVPGKARLFWQIRSPRPGAQCVTPTRAVDLWGAAVGCPPCFHLRRANE